jgi:hypothetical protein
MTESRTYQSEGRSEGDCPKCGQPVGIAGVCYGCQLPQMLPTPITKPEEREEREPLYLSDEARKILTKASTDRKFLMINNTLSEECYLEINKVLVSTGGQWEKRRPRHVFICEGKAVDVKAFILSRNQLPTPPVTTDEREPVGDHLYVTRFGVLRCEGCGDSRSLALPMLLRHVRSHMEAFEAAHRDCNLSNRKGDSR